MTIAIVATSGISLINFRGPLIQRWVRLGHRIVAISIETPEEMSTAIATLGAEYRQVPGSRTGIGIREGMTMIKAYRKAFEEIAPDHVFLYMSKPVAFGGIGALRAGVPHIQILVNGLENAYYRHGLKDRLVRTVMSILYRYVGRRSDNVFVQNQDIYDFFRSNRINDGHNMSVINGSGVDMRYFAPKPLPDNAVFLMTARLLWSKGIREYLSAIPIVKAAYPQARFMLVGGLDHNDESLSQAELDSAITDGFIEYLGFADDVRPYLERCSVYVLPSYHEGVPRSVLEAMAVGRAIITTNAPGCRDTVADGQNGYLVPIGDAKTLAAHMITLARNPALRRSMGQSSRNRCAQIFEVNKINHITNHKMGLE